MTGEGGRLGKGTVGGGGWGPRKKLFFKPRRWNSEGGVKQESDITPPVLKKYNSGSLERGSGLVKHSGM